MEYKIGDVFSINLKRYGLFVAFQIADIDAQNGLLVVVLDDFANKPQTLKKVQGLKPLYNDHHYWKNRLFWGFMQDIAQLNPLHLGNLPVKILPENRQNAGWGLDKDGLDQLDYIYSWRKLPREITSKFKNKQRYAINIAQPQNEAFYENLARENPFSHELRASELNEPLLRYLERTPMITKAEFSDTLGTHLDVSRTYLDDLSIDASGVEKITLNRAMSRLMLSGDLGALKCVQCPFEGELLSLQLNLKSPDFSFAGLEKVRDLRLFGAREITIDIAKVARCTPEIRTALINGGNGNLKNTENFTQFKNLEWLWITDAFGFESLPPRSKMPNLRTLWLWSVPKTLATWAKKEYGKSCFLDCKQARDQRWIEANLNNLFGIWDGREGTSKAVAKKAMKAYSVAYKQIDEAVLEGEIAARAEEILAKFISEFNQIERKRGLDTLEAEEVWGALKKLGEKAGLNLAKIERLFDELREF